MAREKGRSAVVSLLEMNMAIQVACYLLDDWNVLYNLMVILLWYPYCVYVY